MLTALQNDSSILRPQDIFRSFTFPRIQNGSRPDWDNYSGISHPSSFDECRLKCVLEAFCVQYSYKSTGECYTNLEFALGRRSAGMQSGWIADRVQDQFKSVSSCDGEEWPGHSSPRHNAMFGIKGTHRGGT
jgi:hypothetical protein